MLDKVKINILKMNKKVEPFAHPFSDTQEDVIDPVASCEMLYPETTKEFKEIQQEQYTLFCMKQLDYGPENITLGKDVEKAKNLKLSLLGIWFRSNDKIQRILNLVQSNRNPSNESLEDSWIDLSNYSIISMLISRNKWGK
ncbi:MAG: DUF1599 domain-containing protein [Pseudomonadales bacterium]|nr:DUF1599 domain-containing protein [Pseudomonadales bacterium]